jgi:ethanolamine utilization protein EutJ
MTLVLAGNYGIPTEEAEVMKLDPANQRDVFPLVKPVIEKMAVIVHRFVKDYPQVDTIYVAGGAGSFDGFEDIMEKECGIRTVKPNHGVLITPLGIAMHCKKAGRRKADKERGGL